MKHFIEPTVFIRSFTCPHCGVIAQQHWWSIAWNKNTYSESRENHLRICHCENCDNRSLWILNTMYYPDTGNAPTPNIDMPESVKNIYLEAASIQSKSPRGAAALLRLGIQLLCKELGEKGDNINEDIASLVEKGLPKIVQQSLDIVRVTGNDAVHPGQIDTDDPATVLQLFNLTNIVIEYITSMPNKVKDLYANLPQDKIKAIEKRDKK